jgi:hypothetical protein
MKSPVAGVVGVAAGILIGAVATYFVLRSFQTRDMDGDPVCEARVVIGPKAGSDTFEVTPKNVCLFVGHHLKWDVRTRAGDTVEIIFTDTDKPFAYDAANSDNTGVGSYKTTRPKLIDSNAALGKPGRFNYKVLWTPAGGTSATEIDPAVCIREG